MEVSSIFGPEHTWPRQDLIALSEEFDAELVALAYTAGVFPMPISGSELTGDLMGWWSPMRRGVLPPETLRVTRSLHQSARKYSVTVDATFEEVVTRCADPGRPFGWIDARIQQVYNELHERGIAHSVECWTPSGELAGGLYGVSIGGLFAGESMFHDPVIGRDASKVALLTLVDLIDDGDERRIIDVQWLTPHLASLGAVEVDRVEYLELLGETLDAPSSRWPE